MFISVFDIAGIQPYIFGGNRLRENLGASHLVELALTGFLEDTLNKDTQTLEWVGGGNAAVVSRDLEAARETANRLSIRLINQAPGLRFVCVHQHWDGVQFSYGAAYRAALSKLQSVKRGRLADAAFDGGGVTERCSSSGEPAIKTRDDRWIGPMTGAKLDAADQATERLDQLFPRGKDYCYTDDMDQLGRSRGERSLIGVIHADANNMGKRFEEAAKDPDARRRLAGLSRSVSRAGEATLKEALDWIEEHLPSLTDPNSGGLQLYMQDEKEIFPVRPVVFGGDDITLVCDGRIALDLAAKLLECWENHSAALLPGGRPGRACAGVALVKAHFPFYRAYEMAETLCRSAKKYLWQNKLDEHSALDYELFAGGAFAEIEDLRERERTPDGDSLTCRPYLVTGEVPATAPFRSWQWFRHKLLREWQEDPRWQEVHTQLKRLAPALLAGEREAREHLLRWEDRIGLKLPAPESLPELAKRGFSAGETPYLDALDLLDKIVPGSCFDPGGAR